MKLNNTIRRYINFIGVENEGWVRIFIVLCYLYIVFTLFLLVIFFPLYIIDSWDYYGLHIYLEEIFFGLFFLFCPLVVISALPILTKLIIKLFRWIIEGFKNIE